MPKLKIFIIVCCCYLSGVFTPICSAQELQTVQVTVTGSAMVSETTTLSQAKMAALNNARALAIEQASGIDVKRLAILEDQLLVADYIKTFSRGFIIHESDIHWQGTWLGANTHQLGIPMVGVTLTAHVVVKDEQFYRQDLLKAALNRKTFRDGEHLSVNVSAQRDTYLLLANYTSDGRIVPLFPNQYQRDNLIKAGEDLEFPGKNARKSPFKVKTYPHHNSDVEAVLVVGLPVNATTQKYQWQELFLPGQEMLYSHYFKQLSGLEVEWLSEHILVYTVNKQ